MVDAEHERELQRVRGEFVLTPDSVCETDRDNPDAMRRVKPLMASRDKTQHSGFFDRRQSSEAAGVSAPLKSHPNLT